MKQAVAAVQRSVLSQPQEYTDDQIAKIFENILQLLWFKLFRYAPYCLCNLKFDCDLPDEGEVQVVVTGMALRLYEPHQKLTSTSSLTQISMPSMKASPLMRSYSTPSRRNSASTNDKRQRLQLSQEDLQFPMEDTGDTAASSPLSQPRHSRSIQNYKQWRPAIELTYLPDIPGGRIVRYLGHMNHFLIRESTSIQECGGLSSFMQQFMAEAHAIARAHVEAIGGNALVAFRVSECVLLEHQTKNQGQSLLNISGDAAEVDYSTTSTGGDTTTTAVSNFQLGTPRSSSKTPCPGAHSQEVQTPRADAVETAL